MPATALASALQQHERKYLAALDRLREIAAGTDVENDVCELTCSSSLGEAVYLIGVLRRLTDGCTPVEIHRAFGAPGDFGYDTPLGDALSRLYRGEP